MKELRAATGIVTCFERWRADHQVRGRHARSRDALVGLICGTRASRAGQGPALPIRLAPQGLRRRLLQQFRFGVRDHAFRQAIRRLSYQPLIDH